jgi:hypothetical protein
VIALIVLASACPAFATAQRTFVSASANDSNPCSLTQPCRSFAAAIAHTNPGGEVVVLDSAGYGPVTIANDVSLIAPPGVHAGISVFAGDGVTVNSPTASVVLRGIAIDGQGGTHGVNVQAATRVRIENCVISNMASSGLHLASANTETIVTDTTIRTNGLGIAITASAPLVLERVRIEQNTAQGLSFTSSSTGAALTAAIIDSAVIANGQEGISIAPPTNTPARVQIERTSIAYNGGVGLLVTPATGAEANVTLVRDIIGHNGSDGIFIVASSPSRADVFLTDSSIDFNHTDGVRVHGDNATLRASGNTGRSIPVPVASTFVCENGATLITLQNNVIDGATNVATCLHSGPGF